MRYGFLNPIFSLVDLTCDFIRHDRDKITSNYKVTDGIRDLQKILDLIEQGKIEELEGNSELKIKLNNLYTDR